MKTSKNPYKTTGYTNGRPTSAVKKERSQERTSPESVLKTLERLESEKAKETAKIEAKAEEAFVAKIAAEPTISDEISEIMKEKVLGLLGTEPLDLTPLDNFDVFWKEHMESWIAYQELQAWKAKRESLRGKLADYAPELFLARQQYVAALAKAKAKDTFVRGVVIAALPPTLPEVQKLQAEIDRIDGRIASALEGIDVYIAELEAAYVSEGHATRVQYIQSNWDLFKAQTNHTTH